MITTEEIATKVYAMLQASEVKNMVQREDFFERVWELVAEIPYGRVVTYGQLADMLAVSDKTVSKWETGKGLPDIGIIKELAEALQVSIAELLTGDVVKNENTSGNMKKMSFYVCPICANVIQSVGEGAFCCCGITLPRLEEEEKDDIHMPQVEVMDGEFHVFLEHEMTKEHYISFFAYVTSNYAQFVKLYPEQNAECRFTRRGHGAVYAYCNRHGLYKVLV